MKLFNLKVIKMIKILNLYIKMKAQKLVLIMNSKINIKKNIKKQIYFMLMKMITNKQK